MSDKIERVSEEHQLTQHHFKTLRDEFAMAALIGLFIDPLKQRTLEWELDDFAHYAYKYADAMMAERSKTK